MSTLLEEFPRVSRSRPCPICGHPDWCLLARDEHAALCQRTESDNQWGDAGWFHRLSGGNRRRGHTRCIDVTKREPANDLSPDAAEYTLRLQASLLKYLAEFLGLSAESSSTGDGVVTRIASDGLPHAGCPRQHNRHPLPL